MTAGGREVSEFRNEHRLQRQRRVENLKFCDKSNMRREDVMEFVDEISRKAKKYERDFEFEHLMIFDEEGKFDKERKFAEFCKTFELNY